MGQLVAWKKTRQDALAQIFAQSYDAIAEETRSSALGENCNSAELENSASLQTHDFFAEKTCLSDYPDSVFGVLACGLVLRGSGKMRELSRRRA